MKIDVRSWKFKFSILMIILIIIIYGSNILILKDPEHVISYIWTHLGFIPVDILLVAFLLDEIISKKEHEAVLEKLDMLMGTFFSEIGNDLIGMLSTANKYKADTEYLKSINSWTEEDYNKRLKNFDEKAIDFKAELSGEEREEFLNNLRDLLISKRELLINFMNNSNLLEKDEFTSLILAIFHLDEELEHRTDLSNVRDADFNHLNGDMKRIYSKLIHEWIYYLSYLNKHYPYMISLAIRTNPFDEGQEDASVKE